MNLRRLAGALLALVALPGSGVGCGSSTDTAQAGASICSGSVHRWGSTYTLELDILLAIDNSRSMADKQQVLGLAVPELVNRLINPLCLDANRVPTATQPAGPDDPCPAGGYRQLDAFVDVHVGVIDSSLGGHGSDACPDQVPKAPDCGGTSTNASNDDHGHLLTRADPCYPGQLPTYADLGFLAWDLEARDSPPGETDAVKLQKSLTDLVRGVGQLGCGFESQNEAWYRFLVDPSPYQSITVSGGVAVPAGRDDVLLKQRADFLRPSSALAIVMLTDENDCSVREGGQYYLATQLSAVGKPFHLPPARSECAKNPNDACCKSCGEPAGSCPADPSCSSPLDSVSDNINLRCFDDKRRFGVDFLYPWQRYVNALTQASINPANVDLSLAGLAGTPNPIFSNLHPDVPARVRDGGQVFLAGIVGVPWQDIARRDKNDLPDLLHGLDQWGNPVGGFQGPPQLSANGTWDVILGDPDKHVAPKDAHMIESIDPRNGLAPPSSPSGADPINGHEYSVPDRGDLQYACVFDLPPSAVRDCSQPQADCDCSDPSNDNPLCEPNPADGNKRTLQVRAKAYPGIRHLQILKGLDYQGIVASACPRQVVDSAPADFGYRPAIAALAERLIGPAVEGTCPAPLPVGPDGRASCVILEARKTGGPCTCDPAKGRARVPPEHQCVVAAAQAATDYAQEQWSCFCEIEQPTGAAEQACLNDPAAPPVVGGQPVNGWCYIDVTRSPPVGNPLLVESCPQGEKRRVRFVGKGAATPGAALFIACSSP